MTIIGFQFTKLNAQRHAPAKGKINVNRQCSPTNVEHITIGAGQHALKYSFEFSVEYQPSVAIISFEGNITDLVSEEVAKETHTSWTDKKSIPAKQLEHIMNNILNRCHIEAMLMSKELAIPPPIKLPKVKVSMNPKKE